MNKNLFNRYPKITLLFFWILLLVILEAIVLQIHITLEPTYYFSSDYLPPTNNNYHHEYRLPNTKFITKPNKYDSFKPVLNEINSFGIRGQEIQIQEGSERILFLGDSFIEADEVAFDETFSEKLNKNFRGKFQFFAHGISSFAPTTEFSWLYHKGLTLKPNRVYVFLCWNDFYELGTYPLADKPYRNQAIYEGKVPVRYVDREDRVKFELSTQSFLTKVSNFLLESSKTAKIIYISYRKLMRSLNPPLTTFDSIVYFSKPYQEWPSSLKNNVNETIDVLVDMNEFLLKKNIKLTVTLIPNPLQWKDEILGTKKYNKEFIDALKIVDAENFQLSQEGLQEYLSRVLPNKNIQWFDLDTPFKIEKNKSNALFYNEEDGHWNSNGHDIVYKSLKYEFIK